MIAELRSYAVRLVFGQGVQATLADRGIDFLVDEAGKTIRKEPEHLTGVTLRPGETFTVIARPAATRSERKLATASRRLAAAEERMAAPTRRQRRAARHLRAAQRRLDRRRAGTRRWRRAAAAEQAAGRRFDAVMAPSARLARVRDERRRVEDQLAASRAASFARVRGRTSTTTVYE
jgi:hypothetical protein